MIRERGRKWYHYRGQVNSESDEFNSPFYLIINLAIGGVFTDAYNLGDPGSGAPVSMPLPAEMYVDYLKVYEWNNKGEVILGPPPAEAGSFGIYTDLTPTNGGLEAEVSSQIYVWEGTLTAGSIPPYEGSNVLSWQTAGVGWFGAGIMSIQPLNLFDFPDGHLNFRIKIPANITFKIGVIDAWSNQFWVTFPAFQTTYGLVRNGEWGQASIPVGDIRGTAIDLRMLSYPFAILEENGTAGEFALDDIYYDGGAATGIGDGDEANVRHWGLRPNVPNPFNPTTTISFTLPVAQHAKVEIYDPSGKRIRVLFDDMGSAGLNSVTWDGTNASGAKVASGAYFYKLTSGAFRDTRKMVLLK